MLVDEYLKIIKEEFPYFFDDYGFEVTFSIQEKRERYSAGLTSDKYNMKVLFSRQQGGGASYLGSEFAPFQNEYSFMWISLANFVVYLTRQTINWDVANQYKGEERIRPVLHLLSKKFEPYCPKALEMFGSKDVIAQWKPDFDHVLDEILKK